MTNASWTISEETNVDGDRMICVIAENGVTVIWQGYESDDNWSIARKIAAAPALIKLLDDLITEIEATAIEENIGLVDEAMRKDVYELLAKAKGE